MYVRLQEAGTVKLVEKQIWLLLEEQLDTQSLADLYGVTVLTPADPLPSGPSGTAEVPATPRTELETSTIYYGDNLERLRGLPSSSVDLVYCDPPYPSEKFAPSYALDDFAETLRWIDFLRPRAEEVRRVLSSTGSLYWHCGWESSAYVRVMLDQVFGQANFRNEIVLVRRLPSLAEKSGFSKVHDVILYYTKSDTFTWHPKPLSRAREQEAMFSHKDADGRRYRLDALTLPPGTGRIAQTWNGHTACWRMSLARLDQLDADGRIVIAKNGAPRLKRYLDEMPLVPLGDVWTDIRHDRHTRHREHFVSQPIALMERIIEVSSNPGDVVLDPFLGSGTTLVAAERLQRRWIGVEVSEEMVRLAEKRLVSEAGVEPRLVPHPGIAESRQLSFDVSDHGQVEQ